MINDMAENNIEFLINLYLKSYAYYGLKYNTKRQYRGYLKRFNKRFGHLPLTELENREIYQEITEDIENIARETKHAAAYYQGTIKIMIKYGYQRGVLRHEHSKLLCVKIERSRRTNNAWSAKQIALAKKYASPEFYNLIFFLSHTGLRQSDAIRIKLSEHLKRYKDGELYLCLQQQKVKGHNPTKGMLTAVLSDQVALWLKKQKSTPNGYLLTTPRGKQWTVENISRTWQGIKDKAMKDKASPKFATVTIHGLRKNAVSNLFMAGCTVGQIACVIGWDLKTVHDIVNNHYLTDKIQIAIEAVKNVNKYARDKA